MAGYEQDENEHSPTHGFGSDCSEDLLYQICAEGRASRDPRSDIGSQGELLLLSSYLVHTS